MNNSSIELRLANLENSIFKIFEILGRDPEEFSTPIKKPVEDRNRLSNSLPEKAQKTLVESYEKLSKEARKYGIQFNKGRDARDSLRRLKIAIEAFNTKNVNEFFDEHYLTLCTVGGSDGLVLRKEHFFPSNVNYRRLLANDRIFNVKKPQEYLSASFPANTVRIGKNSELPSVEEEENILENKPHDTNEKTKKPRKKRTKKEEVVSEEALFSKLTRAKGRKATVKTAEKTNIEKDETDEMSYGQILDILDLDSSNLIEEANDPLHNYAEGDHYQSSDDLVESSDYETEEEKDFFNATPSTSEDELEISYGSDDE